MRFVRGTALELRGALVLRALLPVLLSAGCGDDDAVSYERDVKPIFDSRCVICHTDYHELNLAEPFTSEFSMINHRTEWAGEPGSMSGMTEYTLGKEIDIAPGNPEGSFLMEKITNQALLPTACDSTTTRDCPFVKAGLFMPPAPQRLTDVQIAKVRQWIQDGAPNDDVFQNEIANAIFNPAPVSGDVCVEYGSAPNCTPCVKCHYSGAPTFPDLEANQWDNLVGVTAQFRTDLKLVDPGSPDTSLLMLKLVAEGPTSAVGAPMPYGYPPLSDDQVATIGQWIADGARNN